MIPQFLKPRGKGYNGHMDKTPLSFPQNREYETSPLLDPDPTMAGLRQYMDAYIKLVLSRYEMPASTYEGLLNNLRLDVMVAADRYLEGAAERKYKFSAYFSWYVSERLNSTPGLKRRKKTKQEGKRPEPPSHG
jgi:hypothetical protein